MAGGNNGTCRKHAIVAERFDACAYLVFREERKTMTQEDKKLFDEAISYLSR
jgi:hypothetical protein